MSEILSNEDIEYLKNLSEEDIKKWHDGVIAYETLVDPETGEPQGRTVHVNDYEFVRIKATKNPKYYIDFFTEFHTEGPYKNQWVADSMMSITPIKVHADTKKKLLEEMHKQTNVNYQRYNELSFKQQAYNKFLEKIK